MSFRIKNTTDQLSLLKKSQTTLTRQQKKFVEGYEKVFKFIKKQAKDHKLTDKQVEIMYSSFLTQVENLIHGINNASKLVLTDLEAYKTLKRPVSTHPLVQLKNMVNPPKVLVQDGIYFAYLELPLHDINFDLQNYRIVDLCRVGARLFNELPHTTTINFIKPFEFCKELSKMYNCVPYHNFTHALNVGLLFYNCYNKSSLKEYLDEFQVFFALVACLGHDVHHEGLNNLYYSKTKSERATRYGYQGILEKMHLSKYLQFLESPSITLFQTLSKAETDRARKIICRAILATDMASHFSLSDQLKQKVTVSKLHKQGLPIPLTNLGLSSQSQDDRQFLIQVFVHACDIGNPCLNYDNYIHWANMICMEFDQQTVIEEEVGVEVTPFLKYSSMGTFYRSQATFCGMVVYPIWKEIGILFQELEWMAEQVGQNAKKVELLAGKKDEDKQKLKKRK